MLEGKKGVGGGVLSSHSGGDWSHTKRIPFPMAHLAALGSSKEGGRIWRQVCNNNVPGSLCE